MNFLNKWVISLRAYSFTASLIPVITAFFYSKYKGYAPDLILLIYALLTVFFTHACINVLNDLYDYIKGVDDKTTCGSSRLLVDKKVNLDFFKKSWIIYLIASIVFSFFIFQKVGLSILSFIIPGIILALLYTNGIFSLKYYALGEATVFLLLGPVLFIGSVFLFSYQIEFSDILISFITGLMVTNILLINNIRDIQMDSRAGIKTLPMLIGVNRSINLYILFYILSLSIFAVLLYMNFIPFFSIIAFITLPFFVKNIKKSFISVEKKELLFDMDKRSAAAHGLFFLIFIITLVLPEYF